MDGEHGVSEERAETLGRPGDFVECDVSCLDGGKMVKEDDEAGEDAEIETNRYTGHDRDTVGLGSLGRSGSWWELTILVGVMILVVMKSLVSGW